MVRAYSLNLTSSIAGRLGKLLLEKGPLCESQSWPVKMVLIEMAFGFSKYDLLMLPIQHVAISSSSQSIKCFETLLCVIRNALYFIKFWKEIFFRGSGTWSRSHWWTWRQPPPLTKCWEGRKYSSSEQYWQSARFSSGDTYYNQVCLIKSQRKSLQNSDNWTLDLRFMKWNQALTIATSKYHHLYTQWAGKCSLNIIAFIE